MTVFSPEWFSGWYLWLDQISNKMASPIYQEVQHLHIPIIAALLLGLIGATSPCQLSTHTGAIALVSSNFSSATTVYRKVLAVTLGKILMFTILGGVAILLGLHAANLSNHFMPVVEILRRLMGPVFLLSGLILAGFLKANVSFGQAWMMKYRESLALRGFPGYIAFGALLSLCFCPTLFWVFFGILVPLSMHSLGGFLFPGIFAVGTAIPLLLIGCFMAKGGELTRGIFKNVYALNRIATRIAGILFILVGINDIILYWYL